MVTFKQYLAEVRDYHALNMDELIALFRSSYSDSLSLLEHPIYRGTTAKTPFYVQPPADLPRNPQHGGELYTDLLDSNPENEDWPRRTWSTICTSYLKKASDFGDTVCAVFPKNGTRIAIAPEPDIWMLRVHPLDKDMDDFNLMDLQSIMRHEFNANNEDEVRTMVPWIDKALSYDALECDLVSTAALADKVGRSNEVWFEGPSIFIRIQALDEVWKRLKEERLI